MGKADPPASASDDVLLVHARSESGDGYQVVRKRGERLELGEVRKAEEGRPIHGELVRLKPREESERLFDVEVLLPAPKAAPPAPTSGPPKVSSPAYRAGWDATFRRRSSSKSN